MSTALAYELRFGVVRAQDIYVPGLPDNRNDDHVAITSRTYYPKSGLLQDLTTAAADGTGCQSLSHEYRADGNMVRRFRPDMGEAFAYDDLDRLQSWSEIDQETGLAPTGGFNVGYSYDERGNLRNRVATSGVGALGLPSNKPLHIEQTYGARAARAARAILRVLGRSFARLGRTA